MCAIRIKHRRESRYLPYNEHYQILHACEYIDYVAFNVLNVKSTF